MRLTVNYPQRPDRLVLRTELDWNRDVEPVSVVGTEAHFELEFPGPVLELKPCLREGGVVTWSKGPNYGITPNGSQRSLWPHFFGEAKGRVSDVLHVEFEGVTRSVRVYHPPGYDENSLRRFPVLYMQDGKNLFFPEEAFAGN